jgi:hypothetical protein
MKCPHCKTRIKLFSKVWWASGQKAQCPFCMNYISRVFSFNRTAVSFCLGIVVVLLSREFLKDNHPFVYSMAYWFAISIPIIFGRKLSKVAQQGGPADAGTISPRR